MNLRGRQSTSFQQSFATFFRHVVNLLRRRNFALWSSLAGLTVLVTLLLLRSLPEVSDASFPDAKLDRESDIEKLMSKPSEAYCGLHIPPKVCAHGGNVEDGAPPNSKRAFDSAIELGSPCIEVDVSMTKDNELVALHDRDLTELINTKRRPGGGWTPHVSGIPSIGGSTAQPVHVYQQTWSVVKSLAWPDGDTVMKFLDVLQVAVESNVEVIVDIKPPLLEEDASDTTVDTMVHQVVSALKASGCGHLCTVWAKSDEIILKVKKMYAQQRIGIVVKNETDHDARIGSDQIHRLHDKDVAVVGLHWHMASSQTVQHVRDMGRAVWVWTATSAAMMCQALDAGPEAVITGRPRLLLEAIERRSHTCEHT